jgi:hypothetical protein
LPFTQRGVKLGARAYWSDHINPAARDVCLQRNKIKRVKHD